MQLPETPFLTIAEVAKRLATTEEKIEQFLKSGQLYASVDIRHSLLESCDGLCDHEVLLGGHFELSGYQNIYWDENGSYDLQAGHLLLPPEEPEDDKTRRGAVVFLRKLAGDPLQYKDEWIKTGKPRSLRYMWRLGAYGHKVYRPACPIIINRKDIFIEADELKAFEFEMAMEEQKRTRRGSNKTPLEDHPAATEDLENKKQKSRSSEDRETAITLAGTNHKNCPKKTRRQVAVEVAAHFKDEKNKSKNKYTIDTIGRWISHIFPGNLKKPGRPTKKP